MVVEEAKRTGLPASMFSDFEAILNQDYEPASLAEADIIPENLLSNFIEKNHDGQYMVFTDVSMSPDKKDAVTATLTAKPSTFVLEPFYYCKNMVDVIHDDFNVAVWISSIFVFLVVLLTYRNFITALLCFIPMMFSWFTVQGYMALFGLEFNLINIVISTFIFGIGVDYSVFIMEGLLEEFRTENSKMLQAHKIAIFFSALILIIVSASLLLAGHQAIRSMAVSTIIGMMSTIVFSYSLQSFAFRLALHSRHYRSSLRRKYRGKRQFIVAQNV